MQALVVLIFLTAYFDAFQVFALSTMGITISFLLRGVFILGFLKKTVWDGERLQFSASPPIMLLGAFLFAAALSSLNPLIQTSAPMIIQFHKTFAHLTYISAFALICGIYPIKPITWERVFKTWLLISIVVNSFAIYQIFARIYDLPFAWITFSNVSLISRHSGEQITEFGQLSLKFGNFYRATSFFSEPSALAAHNVTIFFIMLMPKFQGNGFIFKSSTLNWTIIILSIIALFLTFSLTGVFGLALVLFVALMSRLHKVLKPIIFWFIIGAAIVVVADRIVYPYYNISVLELFYDRIAGIIQGGDNSSIGGESFFTRAHSGWVGIQIWLSSPITGFGLGCFYLYPGNDIKFPDIGIASALAETGLLGSLAFTAFFLSLFYFSYKYTEKGNSKLPMELRERRVVGLIIYLVLIQFQTNFITSNQIVTSGTWMQMAPILSLLNYALFKSGYRRRELRLVNAPLKVRVEKALAAFRASR